MKAAPHQKRNRAVQGAIGFVMLAFSSPCVIAMISDIITGADNIQGALLVGGFMSFAALAGIFLLVGALRKPKTPAFTVNRHLEREILRIAHAAGGRLTVSELAMQSELSLVESKAALEHFQTCGAANPHLSDGGEFVYVFPHFDPSLDKSAATDPFADTAFDFEDGTDASVEAPAVHKKQT